MPSASAQLTIIPMRNMQIYGKKGTTFVHKISPHQADADLLAPPVTNEEISAGKPQLPAEPDNGHSLKTAPADCPLRLLALAPCMPSLELSLY